MTTTPNPTAELREMVANLIPLDLIHDRDRPGQPKDAFEAADRIIDALRAHGLLSEGAPVEGDAKLLQNSGAPSEEQIARVRRMLKPFGLGDACTDRDLRQALAAASVAPQEPSKIEYQCSGCAGLGEGHDSVLHAKRKLPSDREKLIAEALEYANDPETSASTLRAYLLGVLALAAQLDPEKVAEVLAGDHFIEHFLGAGEHLTLTGKAVEYFARSLCEAHAEGKLTE